MRLPLLFAFVHLALVRLPAHAQLEPPVLSQPETQVPPPPAPPLPVEQGPEEVFAFGDVSPSGLGEALWRHDPDAALAAIETSPTPPSPGVACVEAVLRDMELVAEYLPSEPPVDPLSARLFEDSRARVTRAFQRTLRAHRRCSAGASRIASEPFDVVGPTGVTRVDLVQALEGLRARTEDLVRIAAQIESPEPVEAHRALVVALRRARDIGIERDPDTGLEGELPPSAADEPGVDRGSPNHQEEASSPAAREQSWVTASAFYVMEHGRLPTPDERKTEPSWRLIPLLVGVMEFGLGLALIPATAGSNGGLLDDSRRRLGLIGMSVSGVVSMILSPTWTQRGRRSHLLGSGLVVAGALALGLGTALADVRPRLRAFGTALTASSLVDLAFWMGGAVVQRRWRPTASFSRHHGGLGCRVYF